MKVFKLFILSFLFVALVNISANGQCKTFAKKECLPELGTYIHDGNYHAAVLIEGEEAELYKTFYSDMEYRVAIVGESSLPAIEFTVIDADKNVLYSNKEHDYAKVWDFRLEASQQLKIIVKSTTFNKEGDDPANGCVAIMFGFKMHK